MSVYTRIPNQLDDIAFGLFANEGVIHPKKPQSDNQIMERKFSTLGDSILPTESNCNFTNDINMMYHTQPPKRLKIPIQFLEEEKRDEKLSYPRNDKICERASRTEVAAGKEMKDSFKKGETCADLNESDDCFPNLRESGKDNSGKWEIGTDRNRPTSKLIQDNQDLQKLFDSVRGKESQEQQSKKVGKLELSSTFNWERNQQIEKESKNVYHNADKRIRNASEMNDSVAMTFDDWKSDKNMTKESDEIVRFHLKANDFYNSHEANFTKSNSMLDKQNGAWKNDELDLPKTHGKVRSNAESYWLSKDKKAQKVNDIAGFKENTCVENRMFMDNMNLATSNPGEVYRHSGELLLNAKLSKSHSDKCSQIVNSVDMDERSGNGILQGSYMATWNDTGNSKMTLGNGEERGLKTVGKLKLPTAFASSQGRQNDNAIGNKAKDINFRGQLNSNGKWGKNITGVGKAKLGDNQKNVNKTIIDMKDHQPINEQWASKNVPVGNQVDQENNYLEVAKKEKPEETAHSQNEGKLIGKLDIKAIFHQDREDLSESKREEASVVAKSKAMFDQNSNNKNGIKQRGVGRLVVGASRSERYEEIENLNPEGQVPSNISNQMKEQLEKILQGRSESVSSQVSSSSSSSKKIDNREVGRLSMSSISSLEASFTSPRTNEDLSARSIDDDPFIIGSDCEDGRINTKIKVNNGTLESQLGNIFQKKSEGGGSFSSSAGSSLNTSINAGGNENMATQINVSYDESERNTKRNQLIDAIKEKYTSDEDTRETQKKEEEIERNDHSKSEGNQTKARNYEYNESDKENKGEQRQRNRGRVSIPNIFNSKSENVDGKAKNSSNNARNWKSTNRSNFKEEIPVGYNGGKPLETGIQTPIPKEASTSAEIKDNDNAEIPNKGSDGIKIMNGSSKFLEEQTLASEKSAYVLSNDKKINIENGFNVKDNGNNNAKKVNFQSGVGIIRDDGSIDSVPRKQETGGKLSLSLLKSFEGGNAIRDRPGTPGRNHSLKPRGIFGEVWNKERKALPVLEEKVPNEGNDVVIEREVLKFNDTEKVSFHENSAHGKSKQNEKMVNEKAATLTPVNAEYRESPKRVVGKLSIPAMFK